MQFDLLTVQNMWEWLPTEENDNEDESEGKRLLDLKGLLVMDRTQPYGTKER
jgi:hypothetical protein